jgi:hypothetical protein
VTLELDHVLVFVDPAVPELLALEAAGFSAKPAHPHPGQGTANRSVLFPRNYLELIYLASRAEAEANVMRLDRRADWATTGACPFGFGLRGEIPAAARAEFWPYHPPYGRPGWPPIWVHTSHLETPDAPLLFVMEPSAARPLEVMRPSAWPGAPISRVHGTTGIAHVRVRTPWRTQGCTTWPSSVPLPEVELTHGPRPHVTVALDGEPFAPVAAGALLTVRTRGA